MWRLYCRFVERVDRIAAKHRKTLTRRRERAGWKQRKKNAVIPSIGQLNDCRASVHKLMIHAVPNVQWVICGALPHSAAVRAVTEMKDHHHPNQQQQQAHKKNHSKIPNSPPIYRTTVKDSLRALSKPIPARRQCLGYDNNKAPSSMTK